MSGIALLLLANAVDAVKEVAAGRLLAKADALAVTFLTFVLATSVFVVLDRAARHGQSAPIPRRDLLLLNVTTAMTWIGFFEGLAHVEPAVVSALVGALAPVITVAFDAKLRPGKSRPKRDIGMAILISIAGSVLTAVTVLGKSALGPSSVETPVGVAIGLFATAVCATGFSSTAVVLKRLSDAHVPTTRVMAHRFYFLIAVSGIFAALRGTIVDVGRAYWPVLVPLTLVGVVGGLFIVQAGVRRTEPITVSALVATAPLMTLIVQLFDDRLVFAPASFIGVVGLSCIATFAAVVHVKHSRRSNAPLID